ncbi:MAG TPA: hypothetical protein VKA68_10675 [bacterium]|nr:hypothetical protein [bacterium]
MALRKILITVKIYPGFSTREEEVIYAAGVEEDGTWVRIAPLRFERRCYANQYRKYHWIEMDLVRDRSDQRRESYRPKRRGTPVRILEEVNQNNNWELRKKIALQNVYVGMNRLLADAKSGNRALSLATFKPARIVNFFWEETTREWSDRQQRWLEQWNLMERTNGMLRPIRKLPYLFSYTIEDINGNESTLMIDDWDVGRFFWDRLQHRNQDEQAALQDVRNRYFNEFIRDRDVYFFLNTVRISHFSARNPFFIVGTFHPMKEQQLSFDFGS